GSESPRPFSLEGPAAPALHSIPARSFGRPSALTSQGVTMSRMLLVRPHFAFLGVLLGFGLAVAPAWALYIRPEIIKAPVTRLADNLQAHLKKNPKDVQARFNLARLYAMAYALKTDTADALKGKENQGAWFGFEPRPIPFQVKKTDDAGKQDVA